MSDISPLLSRPGAVAATGPDEGVAWHYGDPIAEQRALERGQGVVDQSHLAVITVSGPDRLTWLNSLTSQSLLGLEPRRSTETLLLSPQGRMEAALAVVDDGETTWLITEPAQRESVREWLDKMRFALRVEVADVTADWAVIGEAIDAESRAGESLAWRDPWPAIGDGGTRYGPDEGEHPGAERPWRLVLVPRASLVGEIAAREQAGWMLAGTWAADSLRVAAWRPRFAREVDARTIAHEVDWLRTAVHLHKGCYRGQETVARVHNLGRPPRRLVHLHLDGSVDVLPEPGAKVFNGDREVGVVTSAARHHAEGPIALALVKRATPLDAELDVVDESAPEVRIAAAQTEIVPVDGVAVSRPAARGPLTKGLPRTGMIGSA
ncbi:folate-binding protein YgfZ [Rarobacter faecitabidus]|uniref:Aminomethyltransferase folate-binding domain-containing protein n=1 Tax=Rarobacter faecitabidus TaxID=13243 RepID=A0A542ZTL7_RARFA|nr:glycine cleavage T C-terminal barrel domain-containing protein [Rarobacter faecitabidus]TQL63606.1 hypothetical protein FB461_0072 [Rarobacter faecitabidus]